jgi:hypothetical protein
VPQASLLTADFPPAVGLTNVELWLQPVELPKKRSQVLHRGQGVGMLVAEHAAKTGHSTVVELAGTFKVAEDSTSPGEMAHRYQGVGVVVAEHLLAAGQGLLE